MVIQRVIIEDGNGALIQISDPKVNEAVHRALLRKRVIDLYAELKNTGVRDAVFQNIAERTNTDFNTVWNLIYRSKDES